MRVRTRPSNPVTIHEMLNRSAYSGTYLVLGVVLLASLIASAGIGAFTFTPSEMVRYVGEGFGWIATTPSDTLNRNVEQLQGEHDSHREKVETFTAQLEQRKTAHDQVVEAERAATSHLNDSRTEMQRLRGRLASLEALQHAALGQEKSAAGDWLARLGLDKSQRLGEVLEVDEGWDNAVETVLAGWLEGVLVESPVAHGAELAELRETDLVLVASAAGAVCAGCGLALNLVGWRWMKRAIGAP